MALDWIALGLAFLMALLMWGYWDGYRQRIGGPWDREIRRAFLLALEDGEWRSGFEIAKTIAGPGGQLMATGTIYLVIARMCDDGQVDRERRWQVNKLRYCYRITDAGRAALAEQNRAATMGEG